MSAPYFLRWTLCLTLLALPVAEAALAQNSTQTSTQTAAGAAAAHPAFTVQVVGRGRPVIFIPGLNCPAAVWDAAVARYRGQYQLHLVSVAGFAGVAAQQPVPENLLRDTRDQLLAYVKAQHLTRPAVVGHSLGGFLALWMAATDPAALGPLEIVDSLPFLGAIQNPAATPETARPQAEQMRQGMRRGHLPLPAARQMLASMVTDTARVSQLVRWGQASDPATTAQAYYDLGTIDLRADLARIRQPVTVLGTWIAYQAYGATEASTRAIFTAQYARLPQARIEMSKAGRHFLMYDDPALFFAQTDALLKPAAASK